MAHLLSPLSGGGEVYKSKMIRTPKFKSKNFYCTNLVLQKLVCTSQ